MRSLQSSRSAALGRSSGRPRRGARTRGVTLMELMAVIVMIGIFMVLAGPTLGGVLEDRHNMRAADEIGGMFRIARNRALATGGAHLVRVTSSGGGLRFELRAAVSLAGGPTPSCSAIAWTAADSRLLSSVDFATGKTNDTVSDWAGKNIRVVAISDGFGTTPPARDYCVTPGGNAYWNSTGTWTRPVGSDTGRYLIQRLNTVGGPIGIQRVVRVSPGGIPQIEAS